MNKTKFISLVAGMVFAAIFAFSCSGSDDPPPPNEPPEPSSSIGSSSSSDTTPGSSGSSEDSSSSVLVYSCQLSIGCIKTTLEDCLSIGGSVVVVCQEPSFSSSDDFQPSLSSSSSSDETPGSSSSSSDDFQPPLSSSSSSNAMPRSSSSSSSLSSSNRSSSSDVSFYSCQLSMGCVQTTIADCLSIGGSIVAVCRVSSSSSALAPSSSSKSSSSSVMPSSSSVKPSSSSAPPSSSSVALIYVGQTYKTVKIGTQTWMAENLNYAVAGSKCYGEGGEVFIGRDENNNPITKTLSPAEVQANCVKYGRLYDWATAMALLSSCNSSSCSSQIQSPHRGICPPDWHIPSLADWYVMRNYFGGESEGSKLKATSGWNNGGNGTDQYGFSALPGGLGNSDGSFSSVGNLGYWWSASEINSLAAENLGMYYSTVSANSPGGTKSNLQSVRCLQD